MVKKFEVVISGISGKFPQCDNVKQLEEKIYSFENFVTDDETKWARTGQVPHPMGKIKDPMKFDNSFFRISDKLYSNMDLNQRSFLESSFEAICDSGTPPQSIWGSNTAIIIGSFRCEPEVCCFFRGKRDNDHYNILGFSRCMEANRTSFFFNSNGLSNSLVTPNTSQALEVAFDRVASGECRAALVGSTNCIMGPEQSFHMDGLRRLNTDGKTKCFSADADGHSLSDGTVMLFLQRAEDALRSYGTIVKVSCSADCSSTIQMTDPPSPRAFTSFLSDFYSDLPIDKSQVGYVEADGTANLYCDAMELNGISEVLSPGRKTPLLVGSIKSRLGHSEGASPFFAIVNAIISMKTGYIPPTINYNSPNPHVPGLVDGRLKVVTEKTPLVGDYVAVTSFSLVSTMCHILLKRNPRTVTTTTTLMLPPEIPRLFLLSGRNDAGMENVLKKTVMVPIDDNYYLLNHRLFKQEIPQHIYRGYALRTGQEKKLSIKGYQGKKKPLWFVFAGMGSQWNEMGTSLLTLPMFRRSIEKSHALLKTKGLDLISFLTSNDPTIFDNILHSFVSIAAVQIALVDILEELGIVPDGMIGHSVGEFGCAYADKTVTAEQTILAAYARGTASNEATLIDGMMAAVGMGYNQIKNNLPPGVEVACHNSDSSCTLSGPTELVRNYVDQLRSKDIFCKLVNVANIAYHSANIKPASPLLFKYLKEVLVDPKPRSSKWISSSVPEKYWNTDLAKYSSTEYHTNNLLSPVLFEEASAHIPRDAICVEIAPHGLLQAILKRSLKACVHIPLTNRNRKDGATFFVEALGELYANGVEMDLSKLYPLPELPLPREIDYLHPIVTWNLSEKSVPATMLEWIDILNAWRQLYQNDEENNSAKYCWKEVEIFENSQDQVCFWTENVICGFRIYPQAAHLCLLMNFLAEQLRNIKNFQSYSFENVKFVDTLKLEKGKIPKMIIYHQNAIGNFENSVENELQVTGILMPLYCNKKLISTSLLALEDLVDSSSRHLTHQELNSYFFHHLNCSFQGSFDNVSSITISNKGFVGKAKWTGKVDRYIDAILKMIILYHSLECNGLVEVKSFHQLIFDPTELSEDEQEIEVRYNATVNYLAAKGVRLFDVKTELSEIQPTLHLDIDRQHFLPYSTVDCQGEFMKVLVQVIYENLKETDMWAHVVGDERSSIYQQVTRNKEFRALLKIKGNVKILGSKTVMMVKEANNKIIMLSDGELSESHMKLLSHPIHDVFLIREEGLSKTSPLPNHMTPILQQQIAPHSKRVLYKKGKRSITNFNFIYMKEGQEANKSEVGLPQKKNVFIITYDTLSRIPNIIEQKAQLLQTPNSRFMFVEKGGSKFDPTNKFYLDQLEKDLKVSISHKGEWGSLREFNMSVPFVPQQQNTQVQQPLSKLRCNDVNVKVLGINAEHPVCPTLEDELGVLEYAGEAGGKSVFGLGRLTKDHYLEVDQDLRWTLPSGWSAPQAASVPLSYCIAYYLLDIMVNDYPPESILIHGGHTPVSQAVISVALSHNLNVYTSCFSDEQKQLISTLFPQINLDRIYLLTEETQSEFMVDLIYRTKGGVDVVVDTLRDRLINASSLNCIKSEAKYFLICSNSTQTGFSVGMNIFLRDSSVLGCNPQLLLQLRREEKIKLHNLVEAGIRSGVVRPFESTLQPASNCTRAHGLQAVIRASEQVEVKKVLLTMDEEESTCEETKASNVIVGDVNSIWLDIMCWLVSRGAINFYVVLNQKDIPTVTQIRVDKFLKTRKYINVEFIDSDKIATPQSCEQVLQKIASTGPIDNAFYISDESEAHWQEGVLRKHTSGNLIYVGKRVSEEVGKRDGSKVLSLVLKNNQDQFRNRAVVNILDKWSSLQRADQHDEIIINVHDELVDDSTIGEKQDILPRTVKELVDLGTHSRCTECRLHEINTTSRSYEFSKGVDPVFMFPGFHRDKMVELAATSLNPTFIAAYPSTIGSIDLAAEQFSKELISKFDQKMYTLVAEGWSGPLVLKVVKNIEKDNRVCQVILLDGEPVCIKAWNDNLAHAQSIIAKNLPSYRKDEEEVTLLNLKEWVEDMSQDMSKNTEYTSSQVNKGLSVLIDRLEAVQNNSCQFTLSKSKVDLFSPAHVSRDVTFLDAICKIPFRHHKVDDVDWPNVSLLMSPFVRQSVMKLVTAEFKHPAKPQDITTSSSLRPIYCYEFHAKGIYPPNHNF